MIQIFLQVLNGSLAVFWVILGILLLRLLLRKTPKWIQCLLWSVAALRLIIPVTLQSSFSLLPSAQVIPTDITTATTPALHSGIPVVDRAVNPLFTADLAPKANILDQILAYAGWIWLVGVGVMLLISAVSWLRLRLRLRISLPLSNNVYLCDSIDTPFVLGILRPRIYLPSALAEEQRPFVLAHERAHIRRKDHWWKPLGYLLLSVHWFNPLLWVSYILLCRDIEQACDDKVIKSMSAAEKKGYSEALLACSFHNRLITACPVAFGEVGVKTRIRGILNYKRPAFWVLLASCVAVAVAALCFLTDPIPCDHTYEAATLRASSCTQTGVQKQTCKDCGHSYTEPLPLLAHTYDNGVTLAVATCTHSGTKLHHCSQCAAAQEEVLPLTAHTPGKVYMLDAATCTREGTQRAVCQVCQEEMITKTPVQRDAHLLEDTLLQPSTCAVAGKVLRSCKHCDYTEELTLPLSETHTFKETHRITGTCCTQGQIQYSCSICGEQKTQYLGFADHQYQVTDWYGNKTCLHCNHSVFYSCDEAGPVSGKQPGPLSNFMYTHTTPRDPAIKPFEPSR